MILRRFAHHLKEQNWFAVILDFLVVVLGIFVGLQAENWYQFKQDRLLEQEYLVRIKSDLNNDLTYFDFIEKEHRQKQTNIAFLDAARKDRNLVKEQPTTFAQALDSLEFYRKIAPNSATWQELISSGRLGLIQSQSLKALLSEYYEHFIHIHTGEELKDAATIDYRRLTNDLFTIQQAQQMVHNQFDSFSAEVATGIAERFYQNSKIQAILPRLMGRLESDLWILDNDRGRVNRILAVMNNAATHSP